MSLVSVSVGGMLDLLPLSRSRRRALVRSGAMNVLLSVLFIVGVVGGLLTVNLLLQSLYSLFVSRKG